MINTCRTYKPYQALQAIEAFNSRDESKVHEFIWSEYFNYESQANLSKAIDTYG